MVFKLKLLISRLIKFIIWFIILGGWLGIGILYLVWNGIWGVDGIGGEIGAELLVLGG